MDKYEKLLSRPIPEEEKKRLRAKCPDWEPRCIFRVGITLCAEEKGVKCPYVDYGGAYEEEDGDEQGT